MKKLLLLPLLIILFVPVAAQNWVTITDVGFANKLNEIIPECMDGNQMDTECSGVVNAINLTVNNSGIYNLSGLEYFVSLQELFCYNNYLNALPELPPSLTSLICRGNNLTGLPELPQTLLYLDCKENSLISLPTMPPSLTHLLCEQNDLSSLPVLPPLLYTLFCDHNNLNSLPELPQSLDILSCEHNNIDILPELPLSLTSLRTEDNNLITLPALPQSLTELHCSSNFLSSLPDLPDSLTILFCGYNNLTSLPNLPQSLSELITPHNNLSTLPELPESLTWLSCFNNDLSSLPELPQSLLQLQCFSNNLTSLPELPQSLLHVHCYNNNLSWLPELPDSLINLICYDNNLVSLPELPSALLRLRCQDNQLTCLPTLPVSLSNSGITWFNISNNPFTCLPNYVPAMSGGTNSQWLSYPLCYLGDTNNNPYDCSSSGSIAGAVFQDDNTNCQWEETETGVVNVPLNILNESGELMATTFTYGNSIYNFVADTGYYTVQLVTENMPFQASCDDPGEAQNVDLTTNAPSALNVDFGVECLPGFDVGVQSVVTSGWIFPGQTHTLTIAAGDMTNWYNQQCAQEVGGTVTVYVEGPVNYVGPASNALTPTVTGELQFTYDIPDFAAVNFQQDFALLLETDTTAQAEDLVCVNIVVNPMDGDFNPENNTYNHCYEVVNSYDPNIKQVWPQDVEPGYDGYFNYTIYFQNTGTAPAFNIRVADTLDTNLDLSTFQVTGYSHECLTYVSGNVATFRFNNIMLPDSTSDFDGSIGYVQYRIKAVEDLPVGTIIENTAHIYFDFNDAIVTNTTQNEFVIDTGVDQPQQQLATVFPNPGTGQFNVLLSGSKTGITHLEVYNLSGQRVFQQQVNENRVMLDLTDYPSGMYLLHVRNEQGSEAVRIVKH